jgi:hypothetical protein
LNDTSLIFCFSSVPTSFISAIFCVVGGMNRLTKSDFDHIIRPLEDGSEKMQCIEIHGNKNGRLLVISVYLQAKGNKNHVTEFQEYISIIRAHVLMFLQLNDTSLIFCFSSVPTSFISAIFCVVGGLDRLTMVKSIMLVK